MVFLCMIEKCDMHYFSKEKDKSKHLSYLFCVTKSSNTNLVNV